MTETTDPLAAASALESTGRWSEAIDLLRRTNHQQRCDEVEIELAALRHRAAAAVPRQEGGSRPRAAAATSVPTGDQGLPERDVNELAPGDLAASLAESGSLLLTHAIDAAHCARLVNAVDRAFASHEAWTTTAPPDAWFHRLPVSPEESESLSRIWVHAANGVLLADSPRALFEVLELYDALGLRRVAEEYLGARPLLSANKCTLRRVPVDAVGGWHQDGAFLGEGLRALNFWLTLTDCDDTTPGLEVVVESYDHIVETGTGTSYFDWTVGPEVVEEGGSVVLRPSFRAGDMLVFDEMMLHRTAMGPDMTRERYTVEFWCFAPSAYPSGHVPMVW